jgi:hypothetical protein
MALRRSTVNEDSKRCLLNRNQVLNLLQVNETNFQQLIDTRQLLELRIGGERRFDSKDVYQLVEAYKSTAARRINE